MITKLFDTEMDMNPAAWNFMHRLADLEPHTAEYVNADDERVSSREVFSPGYQIEARVRPFHNGREQGFVVVIKHPRPHGPICYKSESTCIAFFTHRNTGEGLCAVKWEDEESYPSDWYTWNDFPEGTTKWNYIELGEDEYEAEKLVLDAIAEYAKPIDQNQEVA